MIPLPYVYGLKLSQKVTPHPLEEGCFPGGAAHSQVIEYSKEKRGKERSG
jgi:hypothetical protein